MSQGTYKSGAKTGLWKYWWSSGEFWKEVQFIDGVEQSAAPLACESIEGDWAFDGEQREMGCQICQPKTYVEDGLERLGVWSWYHGNGKPERIANFERGQLNGQWERFFDNGQSMMVGDYEKDPSGQWRRPISSRRSPI